MSGEGYRDFRILEKEPGRAGNGRRQNWEILRQVGAQYVFCINGRALFQAET